MTRGEGDYAFRFTGERVDVRDLPTRLDDINEKDGRRRSEQLGEELGDLQELLYAAGTEALLVVLQGMDTSGKDGTIRRVFRDMDPQGVRVAPFIAPTPLELKHDFLWRVHVAAPELGMVVIFNRSHYEAVLVERVKGIVPEAVWQPRYEQIRAFEHLLVDSRTIVLKFFLHISPGEQEKRLLAREQDVEKAWKLSIGDWVDRRHWDDFQAAYGDAISMTATDDAPWWVVPADRKWYRDLAVAQVLVDTLRPYRSQWLDALRARGERELAEIAKARAETVAGMASTSAGGGKPGKSRGKSDGGRHRRG